VAAVGRSLLVESGIVCPFVVVSFWSSLPIVVVMVVPVWVASVSGGPPVNLHGKEILGTGTTTVSLLIIDRVD